MRALMLVSAFIDAGLRERVAQDLAPRPEYLALEESGAVELLDWSNLGEGGRRTSWQSIRHVRAALRRLPDLDVVFSDGEHLGIPLALAMRTLRRSRPHLVLGHHLTTRSKRPLFRRLGAWRGMDRILLHSERQRELAIEDLRIPAGRLSLIPYAADQEFWRPLDLPEEPLIVTAGREHRDYATLATACSGLDVRVRLAAGSVHSPTSNQLQPGAWPDNFEPGFADYVTLRNLYARARLVVVPVVETDFQAGVTTVLEAMAMGRAVITTATSGRSEVIQDGINGVLVPPGDPDALRRAIVHLLEHPEERERLGHAARHTATTTHSLETYARSLIEHLRSLTPQLQLDIGS